MDTINEMVGSLKKHPHVLGLVEFGSSCNKGTLLPPSDYDLFVITNDRPTEIKVLHFFVEDIPVDLNVRSLEEMIPEVMEGFDGAILDGCVIFDPIGVVTQRLAELKEKRVRRGLPERAALRLRQVHRSYFEKIKRREATEPTSCRIVLSHNLSELIRVYPLLFPFPDRLAPPGITSTIHQIKVTAPVLYRKIEAYYSSKDLHEQIAISQEITEDILQPIGGMWRTDELIGLGSMATTDASPKARALYSYLFEESFHP